MSYVQCGCEGCPCGDSSPRNPWRGACGKASNMGFGALTVGEEARGVSVAAAAKADCGCGNTIRALKGRVRALMEENVRLEMRAERALEMLSQPWHRPDRVRAILRGDA